MTGQPPRRRRPIPGHAPSASRPVTPSHCGSMSSRPRDILCVAHRPVDWSPLTRARPPGWSPSRPGPRPCARLRSRPSRSTRPNEVRWSACSCGNGVQPIPVHPKHEADLVHDDWFSVNLSSGAAHRSTTARWTSPPSTRLRKAVRTHLADLHLYNYTADEILPVQEPLPRVRACPASARGRVDQTITMVPVPRDHARRCAGGPGVDIFTLLPVQCPVASTHPPGRCWIEEAASGRLRPWCRAHTLSLGDRLPGCANYRDPAGLPERPHGGAPGCSLLDRRLLAAQLLAQLEYRTQDVASQVRARWFTRVDAMTWEWCRASGWPGSGRARRLRIRACSVTWVTPLARRIIDRAAHSWSVWTQSPKILAQVRNGLAAAIETRQP